MGCYKEVLVHYLSWGERLSLEWFLLVVFLDLVCFSTPRGAIKFLNTHFDHQILFSNFTFLRCL